MAGSSPSQESAVAEGTPPAIRDSHILDPGRFTWKRILPLSLVVLFSLVLRINIAAIPLERDEGEYAYIAQRWLAGDLPYRDAFDQKPPGIFVVYAMMVALGGTSVHAIHWLSHTPLLGVIAFLYLIGRRLFAHSTGWISGLLVIVLVLDSYVLGNAANTELFAILPLTAGMYFAIRAGERASVRNSLIVGLCGGLALCFKQVVLPIVAFQCAWVVGSQWLNRHGSGNQSSPGKPVFPVPSESSRAASVLIHAGLLAAGLLAVLVPTSLYFVLHGAWAEFYDCVIGHNLAYSSQVPLRFYGPILWNTVKGFGFAQGPILALAVWGVVAAWKRREAAMRPCLWWWLGSIVAISVGGIYREHYFILIMPVTALLAAYGLRELAPILEPKRQHWQSGVASGLAVLAVCWPVYRQRTIYFGGSAEMACRIIYGGNPFFESRPLANLLKSNSTSDDKVFVFGSEPQILFYAERKSASRYIFVYPLMGNSNDARERQLSVIADLRREMPKFIVWVHVPTSFAAAPDSPQDLPMALGEIMSTHYSSIVVTTLDRHGRIRLVRPEYDSDTGRAKYAVDTQHERPTVEVWERRDSKSYTEERASREKQMNRIRDKLRQNLAGVRERVELAAQAAGRSPWDVQIVAVTKQVDESVARELVELGVTDLGESRPQELWRKHELVPGPVRWHLIGPLQRNKARRTLPLVNLVHSVDSASLLNRLDELAAELSLCPNVLLEVNTSGEANKHGFRPDEISAVIEAASDLMRVQIRGLMTMAPYDSDPDRARPYFASLRELRDRVRALALANCQLNELSMGMSGDFEAAIAEGATIVRIGSALFQGIGEPA